MAGIGRKAWGVAAFLSLLLTGAGAQEAGRLTAEEAVRLAVEQNPAVTAARSRLEAATAGVRGARAPHNPQAELAPGVGFTNGNALLSQQFDISGRRSAQGLAAEGLRLSAEAELNVARLQAAAEARSAYFDLARAVAVQGAAEEAAALARQIRDLVRRRVEIGEAPQVQVTRAEIEVARAEQELARARGEARGRQAVLNVLLGRSAHALLTPAEVLALPEAPPSGAELVRQAVQQRPELAVIQGRVQARQGEVAVARSLRRPELFADFATDIWSLDRDPLQSRNLGLQARLAFPLLDRGRLRAAVDQARAGVREQEAALQAARRTLTVEVERGATELMAAREVAVNYQTTILPRSLELLGATQRGFEVGLSTFLEVLEAQRLVRQTQVEYQNALFDAVRARIALDRSVGAVPGLALSTPTNERSPR
jgi:outer membrane protein, heavy metal efflux system